MKAKNLGNWFEGTQEDFYRMPIDQRGELAFAKTGCLVAFPNWTAPVDCLHPCCRLRRGEITRAMVVNGALRYERTNGWLRFADSAHARKHIASSMRAVRNACRASGSTDIWRSGWQAIVSGGVGAIV